MGQKMESNISSKISLTHGREAKFLRRFFFSEIRSLIGYWRYSYAITAEKSQPKCTKHLLKRGCGSALSKMFFFLEKTDLVNDPSHEPHLDLANNFRLI